MKGEKSVGTQFILRFGMLCFFACTMLSPLFSQSRIPAEANNYIQTTGNTANGDEDPYMVVFYEVPDTITSTLYFAINHPGIDTTSPADPNNPDQGTAGPSWTYYLVGGAGTLSSPTSRQLTFASLGEATTGTILDTKSYTNENGWNYFAGVSPSQGEHIGNKYYFKIVAVAANGDKNGFQLDVSYSNSGTPTGDSSIRAFAYCWTLALLQRTGDTWNLYPFVSDSATGNIDYRNWDMDNGETLAAWDKSGTLLTSPTGSPNGVTWPDNIATTIYSISSETNGTWRLEITETNGSEPAVNTSMFWFENPSGTILRTYAAPYTPPAPSYVTISPSSATAITGTNQDFTLQILDSGGNPVPYVRNIYVTVNGSATISPNNNGATANELIATNGDGLTSFTVTDAAAEPVTVSFYWDGTGGSDNFGTASSDTATVTFQANLPPVISSSSNLSYYSNQAAPINLPAINITDSGTADITAANDIRIRFPSALSAEFLTSVTTPTLTVGGAGGGTVSGTVSYPDSKTLLIDVTIDFAVTNTLTIGGATPLQINSVTDSPSSGRLEMAVDGGTTWSSVDDKVITILDSNPTYTWSGNTDTSWTTASNWAGGTAPPNDGTANIIIPGSRPNYPVLPAADWSINQLTLDASASLSIGANNLTINGTFSNNGTLIISGTGRPNKNDNDSGTVRYTAAGGAITDFGVTDYYNLEIDGAGTFTAATAMVVTNSLTIANSNGVTFTSTLSAPTVTLTNTSAGQTIDFQGAVTIGILNTAAQGYNLRFGGGGTVTGAVTFSNTGTLTLGDDALDSITFSGGVTATTPSTVSVGGTVSTGGGGGQDISLGDAGTPVVLMANTVLSAGAGNITLGGTVDADAAANNRTLTVNSTGTTTLNGAVGATQALLALATDAGGTLSLAAVTTRGAQTYNDATVTLNGSLTVNTAGAGVSIPNAVVLGAGSGTITLTGSNGNNDITLGAVSGAEALALTAGGGDITIGSTDGSPTSLTATSATFTTTGSVTVASGSAVLITADQIALGNTFGNAGAGPLTLQPASDAVTIGLNDSGGTFNLTATELGYLFTTGTVTIGRTTGTGTITIGGSGNINLGGTSYDLVIEGSSSPVTFAASTLTLGDGGTLSFSNGGNITVTPGAPNISIGGAGTVAFPQAGSVGSSGNPLVVSVANLGASTLTGGLYLQAQTNLTVSGALTATGVEIDAGTNSLTVSNPIASGPSALVLTADTLAVGALLSGAAGLTLQPASAGRLVSIGTNGAEFDLDDTELGFLQNGFASITIGRNTSGSVVVDTASFLDPVTIVSGGSLTVNAGAPSLATTQDDAGITVNASGTITVNGAISAHGTGAVYLTATGGTSDIALAANVQSATNGTLTLSAGQDITRTTGTLGAAGSTSLVVLTAGDNIGASGAAIVTDVGTIRASAGGNIYLSEANAVQLGDGGGNVTTSGGLIEIVSGGGLTFGNSVTTTGTGTSISLTATSGGIALSQNVAAANNSPITLTAGGGGSITRTAGTVGAGGSTSLLVLSAGGSLGVSGAAIVTDVGTIRASAAGDIYISEASALQVGDATGPVTTSNGDIYITVAGNMTTGIWGGGDIISTTGGTGVITLITTAGGTLTLSDTVSSAEGGLVTLTNGGALSINDSITARGGLAQSGSGTVSLGTNLTTTGDPVNFLQGVTLTAGCAIDTTNGGSNPAGGNITFQSILSGAQSLSLNGGTGGTVTFTGAVGGTSLTGLTVSGSLSTLFSSTVSVNGVVSITSDEINLNGGAGSFSANNTLLLQPFTTTQAIAIGGGGDMGAGTLDLTAADITALANGFSSITIGSVSGTGSVTITGAVTFLDPVTIRTPGVAGSITVNAQITGSDNASVTLDAGTGGISLGAGIVTSGTAITLQDPVTVSADISLDTTNGGAVPAGALITLNGPVDGNVADTRQLVLRSGQQALTVTQGIGGTNRFSVLTVRSDDLSLSANLRAQTINLYTGTPASRSMVIGGSTGGSFSLDDGELAQLVGFTNLVIGEAGQQAASITVQTATSPEPAASITAYSNSGAGAIILDDEGTSTALATGGAGNITLTAGTGGITSSNATNGVAELSTSGTIALTSAGSIGSAANRIQFPGGQADVIVTNAPGGVWFDGLGSLTLGAITTNSTGLAGLEVTTSGLLTLGGAVATSDGNITLNSGENGITANGTVSGNSLTITNGGAVDLNNPITVPNGFSSVGTSFDNTGAPITTTNTAVTVNHTGAVIIGGALNVGNGVVTVTSIASVTVNAGVSGGSGAVSVSSTGAGVSLNAPINVSTGTVSIDSAAGTSVSAAGDITATGAAAVNFGATLIGPLITAGDVTTSGGAVQFYRPVTLNGNVVVSTGGGNITLSSTVDPQVASTQGLTLLAGTGNINVTGPVGGGQRLGALSITSAADATFTGAVTATSFTQSAGSGTTTFDGAQDYTGNFSFTGTNLVQNGATTVGGNYVFTGAAFTVNNGLAVTGTTTITNSGLFTKNGTGVITATGGFIQNGTGPNSVGADISTTNTDLSFATGITLTGSVAFSTGAGAGNITLSSTVDPQVASTQGLTLLAGTGNINVTGPVGGGQRLGALSITSAADATFTGAVTATSFTQSAGSGTTTFDGAQDYTGNFSFTGTNLVQNGATTVGGNYVFTGAALTVNNGLAVTGTTTITNSGLFTKNGTGVITATGGFIQNGTGPNSVGADISTTNTDLSFATGITLTGSVTFSTGAGAGNITLSSTVDPQVASTQGLTLLAGTGNINVTGPVGGGQRLGALSITSAADATFTGAVTVTSFTQSAGSGTTTFDGAQDYTGNFSFTGTNLVQNGATTVGGNYVFTGAALTTFADLTVAGNLTLSSGTLTLGGLLTLGGSLNIATGTTLNAGGNNISLGGDWTNGGTFTSGGGSQTVTFNGVGAQAIVSGGTSFNNLTINSSGTVTVNTNVVQIGDLIIQNGILDLNGKGWLQNSGGGTATSDTFTGETGTLTLMAGTELRCGTFDSDVGHTIQNFGSNTITASGDVSIAGTFNTPGNSTIAMTGTGKILTAVPQIGSLHIGTGTTGTASGPTATVALGANLSLAGHMEINDEGSLDAAGFDITISGTYWLNRVGAWSSDNQAEPLSLNATRFEPQNGTVTISPAGTGFAIYGHNRWYKLSCIKSGVILKFEEGKIQRFLSGGEFIVQGTSGSEITLTRTTPFGVTEPIDYQIADLDWVPTVTSEPDKDKMWRIDMLPPSTLTMAHVIIKYSDARLHPLGVPDTVELFITTPNNSPPDEIGATCFKWIDGIVVVNSYTEDSDGNGKIDRLRVTAETTLNYDFSGFDITVEGYDIDRTKGVNGFEQKTTGLAPYLGSEFFVWLVEKSYLDTDATPRWRITTNTSLKDQSTGKYKLSQIIPGSLDTPTDTALPRVGYTLSLIGSGDTFIHFSEPVYSDRSGGSFMVSSITGADSLTAVSSAAGGTKEALASFSPSRTLAEIVGTTPLQLQNVWDKAVLPHDYSTDPEWTSFGRPLPPPYNAYGFEGQQNPGTNWANDWPNPIASDLFPTANDNTNPIVHHRISDVLISVPPANASDNRYFVWPLWARDSVSTEVPEAQYESAFPTGSEAASQTVGLVRDFTGNQWLRDQDITLQVRGNPALSPANLSLHFDSSVADTFRASAANGSVGLWLPVFNQGSPSGAAFSGIVPWPNDPAYGGGTGLYSGTQQGATPLWNFNIPASDPRVRSVSTLDFFFTLDDNGTNSNDPLYVARLDVAPGAPIPADWYRRVKPFSFDIHDITKQRSNATILNNVIDPTKGERVRLSYQLTKPGQVTIQVFTLDGDLVQVLYRGYRQAGDYTANWDGKNRGGRVVARGMYFIRIVGPEIDEIRKVMVVKE